MESGIAVKKCSLPSCCSVVSSRHRFLDTIDAKSCFVMAIYDPALANGPRLESSRPLDSNELDPLSQRMVKGLEYHPVSLTPPEIHVAQQTVAGNQNTFSPVGQDTGSSCKTRRGETPRQGYKKGQGPLPPFNQVPIILELTLDCLLF